MWVISLDFITGEVSDLPKVQQDYWTKNSSECRTFSHFKNKQTNKKGAFFPMNNMTPLKEYVLSFSGSLCSYRVSENMAQEAAHVNMKPGDTVLTAPDSEPARSWHLDQLQGSFRLHQRAVIWDLLCSHLFFIVIHIHNGKWEMEKWKKLVKIILNYKAAFFFLPKEVVKSPLESIVSGWVHEHDGSFDYYKN